eukprot:6149353-Pyramimonas_sp.AAC.1
MSVAKSQFRVRAVSITSHVYKDVPREIAMFWARPTPRRRRRHLTIVRVSAAKSQFWARVMATTPHLCEDAPREIAILGKTDTKTTSTTSHFCQYVLHVHARAM